MKYKLVRRVNPTDRTKSKLYATPVNEGQISKAEISKEIVNISSLSRGDVSNVIESLIDVIPKYLFMNKSVKLGELGTLRVSFSSEGVEEESEFNVGLINGLKIIFTPSIELKSQLHNMKFEKAK